MKVYHVASFSGNIGDGANHRGAYGAFRRNIDHDAHFNQCEVRQFYHSWGQRKFDERFVRDANACDLLMIGGGNFFEICWEYSHTGSTIDISDEILDQINVPILVSGIGFDDTKGYTPETEARFGAFLEKLVTRKRAKVLFRNDGSMQLLSRHYDQDLLSKVGEIPDGGFFYSITEPQVDLGKTICFCVARDMANLRYSGEDGYDRFVRTLGAWCDDFLNSYRDYKVVFVPHIYSDVSIIDDVVKSISDSNRRLRILVAPLYATSPEVIDGTFSVYKHCDLVVSMRFHGNVVPIGNCVPTIGAVSLSKHQMLYQGLGLEDRIMSTMNSEFWDDLTCMVVNSLEDGDRIRQRYSEVAKNLRAKEDEAMMSVKQWLGAW